MNGNLTISIIICLYWNLKQLGILDEWALIQLGPYNPVIPMIHTWRVSLSRRIALRGQLKWNYYSCTYWEDFYIHRTSLDLDWQLWNWQWLLDFHFHCRWFEFQILMCLISKLQSIGYTSLPLYSRLTRYYLEMT